jgi:ankyrin repeat protein
MENIFDVPDINWLYECSPYTTSSGFTLLMKWVMLTKKHPFLEYEIKKHINENSESLRDLTFGSESKSINQQNNEGWTPLMLASRNSNTYSTENTVKILIDAGADLNIQEKNGWSSLMLASRNSNTYSTENTVKLLIDAGADVNIQLKSGLTALMLASTNSKTDSTENTVKMLIDAGADVNIQNGRGCTALMLAVQFDEDNTENIVKMLINAKANLNVQNIDCDTVLTIALRGEKYNIARMLVDAGAQVNSRNMTENMTNIYNLILEENELKRINQELIKENNILKDTLELHPDSEKIKELIDHFMGLTNNSLN